MIMIDILMAAYNGEKYIGEQLNSILQQSCQDWQLIIRDDCSTDNTWPILERYRELYPAKIKIIKAEAPCGSAMRNFFTLIDCAESEYVMFSDQDDIWLQDKIKITFNKMADMERKYGTKTPLLVHTDVRVTDENLQTVNDSIFAMQCMDYRKDKLNNLLAANIVTGGTMIVNKALLKYLVQKPKNAVMHDMWLALVAAAFGKIGFVPEATMLYRQHGSNANGAKDVNSLSYCWRRLTSGREIHNGLLKRYQQAEEFRRIFLPQLTDKQAEMLYCYSRFNKMNVLEKIIALCKYDLKKNGFTKILEQIVR